MSSVQLISDGKYDEASKLVDPSSSSSDCKMLSSKLLAELKVQSNLIP